MKTATLGEIIKQSRERTGLSIREFARRSDVSAPFLSDIELGRRYPSDEVLARFAKIFKTPIEELKRYDTRDSISSLKKLMDTNPSWGFALRTVAEKALRGKISPEDLMKME
ncbi:MAG TPA: helix-turn-helix transcriptional regulator [Candidatus Angelobacter sp.]|nr:helix-turn-helix transcriptional regulator [Candidatus Angelobacter sp.]